MEIVKLENESYLKILNHDAMRPFLMSMVSDSNHWLFVSSNGGISAGRKNPEYALFPYYTEDKITESADITGSKTIFQVQTSKDIVVWEPFSERFTNKFFISRNLYKNIYGNKIIFEEINHSLGLTFSYQWNSSKQFGFVRKARILNISDAVYSIRVLDGLQNIMPYGVPSDLQRSTSNLVDAYKRTELEPTAGIGIFALSAIIVDRAEPSEALKANVAWSQGLEKPKYLVSSLQLDSFRKQTEITEENDIKGEKGAFFVVSDFPLPPKNEKKWAIIADVNQTSSQIIGLSETIKKHHDISLQLQKDIDAGTLNLRKLVAGADGLLHTADTLKDIRHFSNVLFNIMRGGIFDNNYQIERKDFSGYLMKANKEVAARSKNFINKLDDIFSLSNLKDLLHKSEDADLIRLCLEYLPLKFSRRHGDPSRPWNYFTINIQDENDGSKILDYEGNWRDLFQNWEALAHSYPQFIEGMIFKFLNASTFDGYNPYRVTKGGFDWETIEHDNPWSYIGYWGDHQIIYLQKFFEIIEKHQPGRLQSLLERDWFVYAAVPYVIKEYDKILKNPKDTIDFDHEWDSAIRKQREMLGADGALMKLRNKEIYRVNLIEKILTTVLAKMSNFIPEAGIWMNTQRPEWNDANNALVGNGVSMVTLYYLHRFLKFFSQILDHTELKNFHISNELNTFYHSVSETLQKFRPLLVNTIGDMDRKEIMDRLGKAASEYRQHIYRNGFSGHKELSSLAELKTFTKVCLDFIQHSIRINQRPDKLFHSYNLLTVKETGISYSHLSEMLEGQVAVLSSDYLNSRQALEILEGLKKSALFRQDQYSYILYPEKDLQGFLQKNEIPVSEAKTSRLIKKLISDRDKKIIELDVKGGIHFNGNFRNAGDLENALEKLASGEYKDLVEREKNLLLEIFEKVFNHKSFTGRSGTFFAYEGLGSIYWHMVSKLLLAVQENCIKAIEDKDDPEVIDKLKDHFYEIEAGIGLHKTPELYGAFPTDPYSHTPKHRGAQQPGMTGQVKEDILSRFGELGLFVKEGQLCFNPRLLKEEEFLKEEKTFISYSVQGEFKQIQLKTGQLGFTICQVPVIYSLGDATTITISYADGKQDKIQSSCLTQEISSQIFNRTGEVDRLEVSLGR